MSESAFGIDHGEISKAFGLGGAAGGARRATGLPKVSGGTGGARKKPGMSTGAKLQTAGNSFKGGAQQAKSSFQGASTPMKAGILGGGGLALTGGLYGANKKPRQ